MAPPLVALLMAVAAAPPLLPPAEDARAATSRGLPPLELEPARSARGAADSAEVDSAPAPPPTAAPGGVTAAAAEPEDAREGRALAEPTRLSEAVRLRSCRVPAPLPPLPRSPVGECLSETGVVAEPVAGVLPELAWPAPIPMPVPMRVPVAPVRAPVAVGRTGLPPLALDETPSGLRLLTDWE